MIVLFRVPCSVNTTVAEREVKLNAGSEATTSLTSAKKEVDLLYDRRCSFFELALPAYEHVPRNYCPSA